MDATSLGRRALGTEPQDIIARLSHFTGNDLTGTLARIETGIRGITALECESFLANARARRDTLAAAAELKRQAGQINVTIHALGILLCLPHILERDERIEYVSLGAGNTGRKFDLETNFRVAEFKFIQWRGGPESIRQNSAFKDYVLLAEYPTTKRKYLYLVGTEQALRFFKGGRSLSSVLSRNEKLRDLFESKFGQKYRTVSDYYADHLSSVQIEDVSLWLSELSNLLAEECDSE